ncbi:MAG TPA: DMT family transporter [Jiangellaceae bacterium]
MNLVLLGAALLAGSLLAVQASSNLQLTKAVGTPFGASTVQLSVAAALLAVLAVATGTIGSVGRAWDVPMWQLLGGLASPLYITSGILLFPRLGALSAVALFVTGQMLASVGLDLSGLLGVPQRSLTVVMATGVTGVLAGIALIIRGQRPAAGRPAPGVVRLRAGSAPQTVNRSETLTRLPIVHAGWMLLGLLAGAALPAQGAVNAQLRANLQAPLAVALISFVVATFAIAAVLLVLLAANATPVPTLQPATRMPWWGWLGGACAVAYVTGTFMLIPEIGAATTVALTVTGQQLASAVIDGRGLFRMPRRTLAPSRLAGMVMLIAGSMLIQFA